jgi:hypothetical protein
MIPLDKKYIIQNINYEFGWKKFMLLAILSALVVYHRLLPVD